MEKLWVELQELIQYILCQAYLNNKICINLFRDEILYDYFIDLGIVDLSLLDRHSLVTLIKYINKKNKCLLGKQSFFLRRQRLFS